MIGKKKTHPVIGGVPTTYVVLGKALGITPQAAAYRYKELQRIHGKTKVTAEHMVAPKIVDPVRDLRRQVRAARQRQEEIDKFALMHGTLHAAMHYDMPEADVIAIQAEQKRLRDHPTS